MGVDLSGGDVLVAEHVLDYTEIGAVLYQVGGEGVAEGVRRDFLMDAGKHGLTLHDCEHRDTAERFAKAVQKQGVIKLGGRQIRSDSQLVPDRGRGHLPHRDYTLLIALADDPDKGLVKVNAGYS